MLTTDFYKVAYLWSGLADWLRGEKQEARRERAEVVEPIAELSFLFLHRK